MRRFASTFVRRVVPALGTTAASIKIVQKNDEPKTTVVTATPSPTAFKLLDQVDDAIALDSQNGSSVKHTIDFTEGLSSVSSIAAMPSPTAFKLLDQVDDAIALDSQNGSIIEAAIDFTKGLFGVGLISTTNVAYCMDNPQEDNDLDDVFDRYGWRRGKIAERRGDSVMKKFHDKRFQVTGLRKAARRWDAHAEATRSYWDAQEAEDVGYISAINRDGEVADTELESDMADLDRQQRRDNLDAAKYQYAYIPPPPVPIAAARHYAQWSSQPHGRPYRGSGSRRRSRSDREPMDRNVAFDVTSTYRRDRHGNVEHDKRSRTGRSLAELEASDRHRSRSRDANRRRRR